jgi:SnoaL-like polyketide cyclase
MTHDEPAMSGRPAQLRFSVDHWAAFWASPHPELAGRIVTPDVVGYWPGDAEPIHGVTQYKRRIASVLAQVPDLRLEVAEHARNGDILFIRWIARGSGPDGPFDLSGVDRGYRRERMRATAEGQVTRWARARAYMRQRWQLNDGKDVGEMADQVEPGGVRTRRDEQGTGESLVLLLARDQAADRSQAVGLLEEALASACAIGMILVSEGIQMLRAAQAGASMSAGPASEAMPEVSRNLFRQEGEYWTVAYEGSVVRLKDAKGLRHLARLLTHPGREFHVTDLEAADSRSAQAAPLGSGEWAGSGELEVRPDLGDAGELLDATAKAAYKTRLDELQAELEEAEGSDDPVRAAKARHELDFLVGELARAVGLGGRDRRAASHAERARLNATRAIRAATANLARANPSLGRHLAATIRTGRYCSYTPDPRAPIIWEC